MMDGTTSAQHTCPSPTTPRQQQKQRAVFLGPTQEQIDASWNIKTYPTASSHTQQASFEWKVRRWSKAVLLESREHYQCCPATQPTNTCSDNCAYQEKIKDLVAAYQSKQHGGAREGNGAGDEEGADELDGDDVHTTIPEEGDAAQERAVERTDETSSRSGIVSTTTRIIQQPTVRAVAQSVNTGELARPSHDIDPKKGCKLLGQARRVGLSRSDRTREQIHLVPALLARLEAKRAATADKAAAATSAETERDATESSTIASFLGKSQATEPSRALSGLIGNESTWGSVAVESVYTLESIPPPPVYRFVMHKLTKISDLLTTSKQFLCEVQGGYSVGRAPLFDILALVHRANFVEERRDKRANDGRMLDRCDLLVCDTGGQVLKVVLEGNYATRWGPQRSGDCARGKEIQPPFAHRPNLRGARRQSTPDHHLNDSITIRRQHNATKLFPIREGDVIAICNLRLTRTNKQRAAKFNGGWPGPAAGGDADDELYAVASSSSADVSMELCWRNQCQEPQDWSLKFDRALDFDPRCKAILALADAWRGNEEG